MVTEEDMFMEMTDKEINHLWDVSLEEGETLLEQWYPTYYVFECRHLRKLRRLMGLRLTMGNEPLVVTC